MDKTNELLKEIEAKLQKANSILEVREEIEKEQHKQFIKGMETIKKLIIAFGHTVTPEMIDITIEDYKKTFKV